MEHRKARNRRGPERIRCAEQHAAPMDIYWMPPAIKGGGRWVGPEKRENSKKTGLGNVVSADD